MSDATEEPPRKRARRVLADAAEATAMPMFASETVPVLAGTQLFHVHGEVLVSSSKFLQNAMKPEWRTDTKPLDLSDDDPVHFQAYCGWLYTKKIVLKAIGNDAHVQFAHLYVFGAKLMDTSFQQDLLKAFVDNASAVKYFPSNETIGYIYDGTTTGDPARRLLVDMFVFKAESTWKTLDTDIVARTRPEFANDVIRALVLQRPRPKGTPPWIQNLEPYLISLDGD